MRGAGVMVRPVVEVQLPGEQRRENIVRVVRITTRHTFQINRGARYCTPGRKVSSTPVRGGDSGTRAVAIRDRRLMAADGG